LSPANGADPSSRAGRRPSDQVDHAKNDSAQIGSSSAAAAIALECGRAPRRTCSEPRRPRPPSTRSRASAPGRARTAPRPQPR
jgi:hypothetical protein